MEFSVAKRSWNEESRRRDCEEREENWRGRKKRKREGEKEDVEGKEPTDGRLRREVEKEMKTLSPDGKISVYTFLINFSARKSFFNDLNF